MEAYNMAQSLRGFLMTKEGVLDSVLNGTVILQEFTKKPLTKQAAEKKNTDSFMK
jgi:hypothetical protein